MSRRIKHAVEQGVWKPFPLKGNKASITHLMFVDDLILFGEANIETILAVKAVLHDFSMKFGLFFNLEKCTHASLGMHLVRPEMLFLLPVYSYF